jgi:hypothetical protein
VVRQFSTTLEDDNQDVRCDLSYDVMCLYHLAYCKYIKVKKEVHILPFPCVGELAGYPINKFAF